MLLLPCLDMQLTWERIAKLEASRDLKSVASNVLRGHDTGEHSFLWQPLRPGLVHLSASHAQPGKACGLNLRTHLG